MQPSDRRDKLNEIRSVARELRATSPSAVPDLTASILGQVDAQRPFLNQRTRDYLWVGRAVLGASVSLAAFGAVLTWRYAPEAVELTNRPAPLSMVMDRATRQAAIRATTLQQTIQSAPEAIASAAPALASVEMLSLTPAEVVGPLIPPGEAARRESPECGSVCCERDAAMWSSVVRIERRTHARPLEAGSIGLPGPGMGAVGSDIMTVVLRARPVSMPRCLPPATAQSRECSFMGHDLLLGTPALVPESRTDDGMTPR